jgi:hypothetical protein
MTPAARRRGRWGTPAWKRIRPETTRRRPTDSRRPTPSRGCRASGSGPREPCASSGSSWVIVGEAESATAVLDFSRMKPAPASVASDDGGGGPLRTLAFVALGVGGAGIITGSVAGVLAIDKKSVIDDSLACEGLSCRDRGLVDSYNTLRTVSSIGLIAGAVVAGVGVTLLFTSSSEKEPGAAAFVGPGSVGVRGRF